VRVTRETNVEAETLSGDDQTTVTDEVSGEHSSVQGPAA